MYEELHNALIIRRPDSPRLALLWMGVGRRMQGVAPLQFMQHSGLESDNLIFLRDPTRSGFLNGCSEAIQDFDALLNWLEALVATFSHVREVFCIGVSSGSIASMAAAEHLNCKSSMSFGPRLHSQEMMLALFEPSGTANDGSARPVHHYRGCPTAERVLTALYVGECKIRELVGLAAREWVPPRVLAAAVDECEPILRLLKGGTATTHHVYYTERNVPDRVCVRVLSARGINLVKHRVWPAPNYPTRRKRWDHDVVPMLIADGSLKDIISGAFAAR